MKRSVTVATTDSDKEAVNDHYLENVREDNEQTVTNLENDMIMKMMSDFVI